MAKEPMLEVAFENSKNGSEMKYLSAFEVQECCNKNKLENLYLNTSLVLFSARVDSTREIQILFQL